MSGNEQPKAPSRRSSGTIRHRRKQLSWPVGRDFRILSIDGGGIRGIFPAAFLAGLEERYLDGESISHYFDLIAGTSTGGVIAIGLGAGLRTSDIASLYIERGCEVFPPASGLTRSLRKLTQFLRYRYDREALTDILAELLGERRLGDSEVRLCIPSFDGTHSDLYIFKTPHHPDFRLDGKENMVKVAAATSAAPTFYRPLEDGGYTFVDGGVWANNPTMIGLVDALSCFSVERGRIRILSLGCGEDPYTVGEIRKRFGGKLAWHDIIFAAMRFQSLSAVGQAGLLIGADRVLRVEPPLSGKQIDLDDWVRAKAELPDAADKSLAEYGEQIRRDFLVEPAVPYHPFETE